MASVEERVIDIVAEQLGVQRPDHPRNFVRQRSGRRFAGYGRIGDGTRRRVRHQHPRRRGREDPDGRPGDRPHRSKAVERPKPPLPDDLHETPRRRHGHGRRHLAWLQGGGTLDSHLQRRERRSQLERFDATELTASASAAKSATGRSTATSSQGRQAVRSLRRSSPMVAGDRRRRRFGHRFLPRKTPGAAA